MDSKVKRAEYKPVNDDTRVIKDINKVKYVDNIVKFERKDKCDVLVSLHNIVELRTFE